MECLDSRTTANVRSRWTRTARQAALAAACTLVGCAHGPGSESTYPVFGGQPVSFRPVSGRVVGVYVPNWESPSLLDRVPAGDVTHVLYAFLHICGPGQLAADAARCAGRRDFELASGPLEDTFDAAFARLKARAPGVQVIASVGGWGGSDPFFHLANDAAARAAFSASAADFLRTHRAFDGIDIDWEHPTTNGSANGIALGSPADGAGYADLMEALRGALDGLGARTQRHYLVTSAVNTARRIVERVDYRRAARSMDLIFMMTYDFYGGWTPVVGNHAALQPSADDREDGLTAGTRTMEAAGVPPGKLVAGVAMYGRGFVGVELPPVGASFTGLPHAGAWQSPEGSLPWREIAGPMIDDQGRGRDGYESVLDPVTQSWNLVNRHDGLFMGADDPRTVLRKGEFARREGLAGVFAWELSQDNGDILNAMNAGVGNVPLKR